MAEKVLKAIALKCGAAAIPGHPREKISLALLIKDDIEHLGRRLDI